MYSGGGGAAYSDDPLFRTCFHLAVLGTELLSELNQEELELQFMEIRKLGKKEIDRKINR